jgi:hypothetical protein
MGATMTTPSRRGLLASVNAGAAAQVTESLVPKVNAALKAQS